MCSVLSVSEDKYNVLTMVDTSVMWSILKLSGRGFMIEMKQTPEFEKWLKSLKDKIAKAKILMRLERMEEGNFGDVEPVGDGLSELRIHQGKGYRIYFGNKNNQIVILLCGGDKSTQQLDIKKAKILAKKWGF